MLEALSQSTTLMKKTVDVVSWRASRIGSMPSTSGEAVVESRTNVTEASLFDEIANRDVLGLERENEELSDMVADLRAQLEQMSSAHALDGGGGPDAGGGSGTAESSARLAEELRAELAQVQADLGDANNKLIQHRKYMMEDMRSVDAQETPNLVDRWVDTLFSTTC